MIVAVCVFCIIRVVASSFDVARAICDKYAMLVVTVELARATDVFELTVGGAGARGDALDGRALLGRARSLIEALAYIGGKLRDNAQTNACFRRVLLDVIQYTHTRAANSAEDWFKAAEDK